MVRTFPHDKLNDPIPLADPHPGRGPGRAPRRPRRGDPRPARAGLHAHDIAGQVHKLSDYHGKTVVVEWTNPECPIVRKHYLSGNMPALQKAAVADGVVWLSINSGHPGGEGDFAPAQVTQWLSSTGAAPTAYMRDQDGRVGHLYGAKATPHMFVVAPDGTLVYAGRHRQHTLGGPGGHPERHELCQGRARLPEGRKAGGGRVDAGLRLSGQVLSLSRA